MRTKKTVIFPLLPRNLKAGTVKNVPGTVSYTHLDVYKRQILWCLSRGLPEPEPSAGKKQAVLCWNRSCRSDRSLQQGKLLAGKIEISKEEGLKCVWT